MRKIITTTLLALLVNICINAQEQKGSPMPSKILGKSTISDIKKAPDHTEWFDKNYQAYQANENIINQLRQISQKKISIEIFYGTWCGDTKREMPRFIKVLDNISFDQSRLTLIGLDNDSTTLKQSPMHEERGKGIYRVPTFIIYENGKELARINEFPSETLERDLLKILKKEKYLPNYAVHAIIDNFLNQGLLFDENISAAGLANRVRSIINDDRELNTIGYVLMAQNKLKEALVVFRMNTNLYPQVANCYDSLGEAYLANNLKEKAIIAYEYALKLDPKNESILAILEKLKKKN